MTTAKKKAQSVQVETRYYETTNVDGVMEFKYRQYTTAKVTPMHERIRNYYPAQTRIGTVVNLLGCFGMVVIDKVIASNDWKWAHEQAVKQYRAKRLQAAKT